MIVIKFYQYGQEFRGFSHERFNDKERERGSE